jgi:hypothetical protein
LWFEASISSDERAGTVSRYQGHVKVDSRDAEWFAVSFADIAGVFSRGDMKYTRFDSATLHSDDLKIGRCDAAGIPAWLARVASKLGVTWNEPYVRTGLRGKKRDRIAKWLVGN